MSDCYKFLGENTRQVISWALFGSTAYFEYNKFILRITFKSSKLHEPFALSPPSWDVLTNSVWCMYTCQHEIFTLGIATNVNTGWKVSEGFWRIFELFLKPVSACVSPNKAPSPELSLENGRILLWLCIIIYINFSFLEVMFCLKVWQLHVRL